MEVEKTVALGHLAAAFERNAFASLLFHEQRSSYVSFASSNVMLGRLKTLTISFSTLEADSGDSIFRTLRADTVLRAQSLFLLKYSSLNFFRSPPAGSSVNSDLMTSRASGEIDSASFSMAMANRTISSCTLECSLSRAAAARRHFRASRYLAEAFVSKRSLNKYLKTYIFGCTPQSR